MKNIKEDNKDSKKRTHVKSKTKINKKSEKSEEIIEYKDKGDSKEISYFRDGDYKPEGRRIAVFKYK
ncbi:MAG: hypothetical protein Q4F66_07155 [Clostridium sp.]|nr:hypothetical protein [Clostridium sp.]